MTSLKPLSSGSSVSSGLTHLQAIAIYATALRVRHWTKNLIVLAAPLFGFQWSHSVLWGAVVAFLGFCCVSSGFYLVNDLVDLHADRRHPVKCHRPIAAGLISPRRAVGMALLLFSGPLVGSWLFCSNLGIVLLGYVLLQIAYNARLKRTVILDIVAIALGFVLRALGGAAATQVVLSPWFVLCTAMLALFLAIEKRKAELRLVQNQPSATRRDVLWRYSLPLLTRMESTVTTSTILTYALWSSGPGVSGASTSWMLITLPCVLYGIFRYQFLSDPDELSRQADPTQGRGVQTERPEELLLSDRPLLLTVMVWMMLVITVLTLKHYALIT